MPRTALTPDELDFMRDRLCAAALEIYMERGLGAVTFRELAEATGVSHTLPYRYFENKEALLASVRVAAFKRFDSYVRAREPIGGSSVDRVFAVVDAYASFVLEHPNEYALIFATPQPPPVRYPALLLARQSLFEHAVGLVQECIDSGVVEGEAREITHAVWACLHGLLTLHVANQLVHGSALQPLIRPTISRLLGLTYTLGVPRIRRRI